MAGIGEQTANNRRMIAQLAQQIDRGLLPLVAGGENVALVDHPNYGNVGDSALWLGARKFLEAHGIRVTYQSSIEAFNMDLMKRRIGRGPILLSGGGNFGDLYKRHQRFRLELLRNCRDNRIVQLPQSICFENEENIEETASAINSHPDFHLFCRDRESVKLAKNWFECHVELCPDMAFYIGPLNCREQAKRPVAFLERTDCESTGAHVIKDGCYRFDWVQEQSSFILKVNKRLTRLCARYVTRLQAFQPLLEWTYDRVAMHRLSSGLRKLCEAEEIITDRLHGHILCVLLNKRHIIIDNNYGKISRFYNCWTKECSGARLYTGVTEEEEGGARQARDEPMFSGY